MAIPNNPTLNEEWTNDATDVTYRWDGERWFIISSLDESNLVSKIEFETDQERQDGDIAGINAEQDVQNDQINALETQVQLLAGVKAVGRWTYRRRVDSSPRPPTLKTFYGTDVRDLSTVLTSWENTNLLMISKTDLDDNTYTFSDFEEGDKVEVIAVDGSSAVYGTVTNNPSLESYGNFVIDVERWRGGPVEEAEYLISAYRPGSSNGEVDLDILDGRYLVKTGDTLTGDLNFQEGSTPSTQFKIDPNSGTSDTNMISLLDGQMRFRTTHTNNPDDRVGSHIVLDPNGGVPQTKIYHVVEPTNDTMVANKLYVDNIAGGKHIPPGLRFEYVRSEAAIAGQLAYFEDAGGLRMRLHKTSKDVTWNQNGPESDATYSEGHMFTVYSIGNNGSWNIIRTGTINRIDWHDVDILCYISSHQTNGAFSTNTNYYVTIAGLF